MLACGGLFLFAKDKKKTKIIAGVNEVVITGAMVDSVEKNYNSAVLLFKGAGFHNVTPVPLRDLNMFIQKKNGQVESITINGNSEFEEGDVVSKDANVLITYHSK